MKFPDGDLYAVEKDGGVYLTGPELEALAGAEQVREHARGAAEEMSAIISLLWSALRKPSIGHVQREDDQGGVSNWVFVPLISVRAKPSVGMVMVRKDGTQETISPGNQRPTDAQRLLKASRRSRGLRTALLLWSVSEPEWWRLVRIIEEIGAVPSKNTPKTNPYYQKWKHFKTCADSGETSGELARHPGRAGKLIANPMSIEDARIFVREILLQKLQ
ncbi:MAG TPA: hypothetical protein VGT81_05095 [Casimicrobiaceae bacterium]|nr:hypothetical protein [Casimicrobiaceae bacterium]